MTKLILLASCIASTLFLQSCGQVLESARLSDTTKDVRALSGQEEFEIDIKSLTFKSARQASNDPYPRKLMITGSGNNANVFDEAEFLVSKIPPTSPHKNYILGIGDTLLFNQLNELEAPTTTQFPKQTIANDYLLGVGDELTFIKLSEEPKTILPNLNKNSGITVEPARDEVIVKSSGIIGTDGNILLLGLGSLNAENRSLNDLQSEVRNILIRNGLEPSFQLEITGFNSKKAFVTFTESEAKFGQNIIRITNLPITLKEVLLSFGLQSSARETLIISLVRDGKKFRMSPEQVFDKSSAAIIIQDRDQIEIAQAKSIITNHSAVVGSNGNILLPKIGSIKAENRTLADVHADITHILLKQDMIPNFQLEITDFKSKKFFLVSKKYGSKVLPITNYELSLKEAILGSGISAIDENELMIVKLIRNDISYQMSFREVLNEIGSMVAIQAGDTIELEPFKYKLGQVFALSGAGNAQMVTISPSKRETLADILFTEEGPLNNLQAKRSEVYLLRGQNPSTAYHLDTQNVSRVLVAAKTELRPNDIIYVADRPIISFARTLSELLPLRILLRDIQNNNIP